MLAVTHTGTLKLFYERCCELYDFAYFSLPLLDMNSNVNANESSLNLSESFLFISPCLS